MDVTVRGRWLDSYRFRLLVGFLLVLVVLAASWTWSLHRPLSAAVVEQQESRLAAVARSGALLIEAGDPAGAGRAAESLARETDTRITIVAADGTVLADSSEDPAAMENHRERPEVSAALDGRTGVDQRLSRTLGTEQLYVAVPATLAEERIAVRASETLATIDQLIAQSRRFGLALLLGALVVAVVLAAKFSRALSRPVGELASAARKMADGDLGVPVPQPSGELGVLADALLALRDETRTRIDALQAEERSMRTVLDGLEDAVWLLEDDTIRFANRASDVLFRRPTAGWRDRCFADVGLPTSLAAHVARSLAEPLRSVHEIGPDPTGRTLRVTVTPLETLEPARRTLVIVSDVTERERLDRIRRDFVANASHELKTPVSGIHLLAQSAAQAAEDGEDEQAVVFARQIEQESLRLQQLVKDLLDLSRLELGSEPGAIADVRGVIENAMTSHRSAAVERGLDLVLDADGAHGEDVYAAADPTDLAVALDNLLDNAVAYTESGTVTVRLSADETTTTIAVSDTGIGIPEADLPRVFERFYRVDRARARSSGGTGLGLSLVKHVAERAGGSIAVESRVGVGSTFTLVLPRAR